MVLALKSLFYPEEPKKKEKKYQMGDIWRSDKYKYTSKITKIDDRNIKVDMVYDNGSVYLNFIQTIPSSTPYNKLLWREPKNKEAK